MPLCSGSAEAGDDCQSWDAPRTTIRASSSLAAETLPMLEYADYPNALAAALKDARRDVKRANEALDAAQREFERIKRELGL